MTPTALNHRRIWMGAAAGTLVWVAWGLLLNGLVLGARYDEAQAAGYFLQSPRYHFFVAGWIVILFLLASVAAWLYAGVRASFGPGPWTALLVGFLLGFAAGFPLSFSCATWLPAPRIFPLGWLVELWGGAILATLTAGGLYREP